MKKEIDTEKMNITTEIIKKKLTVDMKRIMKKYDFVRGIFVNTEHGTVTFAKTGHDLCAMIFTMETEIISQKTKFIEGNKMKDLQLQINPDNKKNPLTG